MSTKAEISPDLKTRKQAAEAINRAMERFPLILGILGELRNAHIPFPGDDDLRHGCDRTLTSMLSELARIDPAPPGKPVKAEEISHGWLTDEKAVRLIDADKLERLQQLIERILGKPQA
jgi:hypothetical protein